ncbi:MAG: DUF3870 domain-containing protein [Synergistaceae bacterium]|jgi:hypothetical protein|nr:DUF3870 domain-containing protein [Synergistaceae bacterium]
MGADIKCYLFSGMALLPEKTDLSHHKYLTIIMEIDLSDGMVKNCDIPIYSGMHKDFVSGIFVGKSLDVGYEYFSKEIDERIHSITKNTLMQAFQSLYNRYITVRKSKRGSGAGQPLPAAEDVNRGE